MNSVETQIALGFRILIAGRPVEGQIHLGVGYALCVRGGGDVTVDLDDISVENLEVVHPAVTLPGVGDYVGPDVGIVDIHCSHDCVAGRTQLENLCRDGGPVGLECCHASPEAVLIVGPTAGSVLVRGTGCPEVVPADVPGDDLRLAGGAPERRIAAECREQLGTGPFVLTEVCACDRYPSVGLDVGFVAGHVALEGTEACGQRIAEGHIVPRVGCGESSSLRRTDEEDHDKDESQQAPYGACHVWSPGEARDSALLPHDPLLCQSLFAMFPWNSTLSRGIGTSPYESSSCDATREATHRCEIPRLTTAASRRGPNRGSHPPESPGAVSAPKCCSQSKASSGRDRKLRCWVLALLEDSEAARVREVLA